MKDFFRDFLLHTVAVLSLFYVIFLVFSAIILWCFDLLALWSLKRVLGVTIIFILCKLIQKSQN